MLRDTGKKSFGHTCVIAASGSDTLTGQCQGEGNLSYYLTYKPSALYDIKIQLADLLCQEKV